MMIHRRPAFSLRSVPFLGLMLMLPVVNAPRALAQAPAAAAAGRQIGTVKAIAGDSITLTTDAGQAVAVSTSADTKVVKLAAGSTDLKTAQPSQLSDVSVGDRVLVTGKAGDTPATFSASRIILMKSSDIAQKNAAEQSQWKTNGVGGIVSDVNPSTGTIVVASGTSKYTVSTTGSTVFKRFSGDSNKYQDAKPGTMAEIHTGDQLQARGQKSADGLSVKAEEVVSGSFKNLSGLVLTADPSSGDITLKDLATKKVVTVHVTPNTNIRQVPPQVARMFASRADNTTPAGGGRGYGPPARGGGAGPAAGGGPDGGRGGMNGGGGELSQMISRLPSEGLADVKKGDAVMIVATEPTPGSATLTAVTLLTGVEPILTANPNGGMDLSGWSMGGAPGGGDSE